MTIDPMDLVLPHLRALESYQGVDPLEVLAREAGIPPEQVVRINGNENPYGPSPKALHVLARASNFHYYPDPHQRLLRAALARYAGVSDDRVVAGNGADEIIDLILRMVVQPGDSTIIPTPTFGVYAFNTRVCGGEPVSVPRTPHWALNVPAIRRTVGPRTRVIFVTTPNNPTGNPATESEVRALLALGPLVAVDETYHEFGSRTFIPLLDEYPNLIVVRTFSKWAALAGLRVGYGIMHPDLARLMMTMKSPYNVNVAAEQAAVASLEDVDVLMDRVRRIVKERERLSAALSKVPGVTQYPSVANFILVQLPPGLAVKVNEGLARRGVFIRYFGSPPLHDCIRISVGLPEHTDATVRALTEVLRSLGVA